VQPADYQEQPTYDPNGNITTYVRHGYGSNIPMDSLTYNYYGGYNRLQRINDGAGGSYTTDLKDQGTGNNYTYDSIGNLKKDVTNGVSNIDWTVYGKIADLTNASGTITYTYDAAGNRISKLSGGRTSIYVRDAQGNILSIYTWPGSGSATQKEVDLYGSSRLGSVGALTVAPTTIALGGSYGNATISTFTRGEKSYELSNHLGNILTTITDKKIAVPSTSNSSLIDHFTADIATAQDYYPFGMLMPGRTYTASTATNYRYGFNGKENDNEVKGVGNEIDYGMRGYDPRVGRFMSVDPISIDYPDLSTYQYASNSPIAFVDQDGLEMGYKTADGTVYYPAPSDHLRTPIPNSWELVDKPDPNGWQYALTGWLDLAPGVNEVKGIDQAITGREWITNRKLSTTERVLAVIPYVGKLKSAGKTILKQTEKVIEKEVVQSTEKAIQNSEKAAEDVSKDITKEGTGEYGDVGGHHVHAKAAFKDAVTYDKNKGFSISQQFMKDNGLDHAAMTRAQRKLFDDLARSGRANSLEEQSRIAKEALKAGGASDELADDLVNQSLENLAKQKVSAPTNIPWNNPKKP
jgi:RHS repeat-associated protein